MIKIVLDTLGGDRSPDANIEGGIKAINSNPDIFLYLVGDENVIKEKLSSFTYNKEQIEIVHAPEVIGCNDKPTEAIRTKKDSSLVKCIELLKSSDEINAMVSVGSTGAVLAGAVLKIGRIKGVKRPALCPLVPTVTNGFVGICDSGANTDCDSEQLVQFAKMGNLYMQKAFGVEKPRVALLNIGTEEEKGDLLRKEVYGKLKELPEINFVGNMESRDLLQGKYDLVVCDGFSGNVLLKSTEGTGLEMLKLIKGAFMKNVKTKIGALLLKKEVYGIKNLMDYNNHGGALLFRCP
ncbi:MAG: phosphate acyltransferase PlsX, partial [Clostridia bacterium]|nr:phosphate acyltransferase PlsX [Clostridia bacterium]